ncbi:MAG: YbjN domain-containing protein [Pseudomonadota bacterium]
MPTRSLTAALVLAASILGAGTVPAMSETINAEDPERLRQLARGFGSAELTTDSVGDPMIRASVAGTNYLMLFYGCTDGAKCRSVQFRAGWSAPNLPPGFINGWNRDNRFGKAYIDSDGDPVLEMDVPMAFGMTAKNFEDTIDWWRISVQGFAGSLRTANEPRSTPSGSSTVPN